MLLFHPQMKINSNSLVLFHYMQFWSAMKHNYFLRHLCIVSNNILSIVSSFLTVVWEWFGYTKQKLFLMLIFLKWRTVEEPGTKIYIHDKNKLTKMCGILCWSATAFRIHRTGLIGVGRAGLIGVGRRAGYRRESRGRHGDQDAEESNKIHYGPVSMIWH